MFDNGGFRLLLAGKTGLVNGCGGGVCCALPAGPGYTGTGPELEAGSDLVAPAAGTGRMGLGFLPKQNPPPTPTPVLFSGALSHPVTWLHRLLGELLTAWLLNGALGPCWPGLDCAVGHSTWRLELLRCRLTASVCAPLQAKPAPWLS